MKKTQRYQKQKQQDQVKLSAIVGGGLVLLGFALFLVFQKPYSASASETTIPDSVVPMAVEFPAPNLVLENVKSGTEALTDYHGKVVLVNNWATWCPPCKAEMPSLQKFYETHSGEGFMIVAVNAGDDRTPVEQFVKEYGLTFRVWLDPNGAALDAFRNANLPSSYVVDRTGIIRYAWTGEISYEMLEKYITPVIQN